MALLRLKPIDLQRKEGDLVINKAGDMRCPSCRGMKMINIVYQMIMLQKILHYSNFHLLVSLVFSCTYYLDIDKHLSSACFIRLYVFCCIASYSLVLCIIIIRYSKHLRISAGQEKGKRASSVLSFGATKPREFICCFAETIATLQCHWVSSLFPSLFYISLTH